MNEFKRSIFSGEIYFVDGKEMMLEDQSDYRSRLDRQKKQKTVWARRPGVVVSSDKVNNESNHVVVAFLTRRAHVGGFYREFSPQQVDVNFDGRVATVLCSRATMIPKKALGAWMGVISQEELNSVIQSIQKSKCVGQEYFDPIYQKESEVNRYGLV